jgi:hypothetical protein
MNADDTKLVIAHTSSGAEALAKKVHSAHVVSAFSTAPSEVLFDVFQAQEAATPPAEPLVLRGPRGSERGRGESDSCCRL